MKGPSKIRERGEIRDREQEQANELDRGHCGQRFRECERRARENHQSRSLPSTNVVRTEHRIDSAEKIKIAPRTNATMRPSQGPSDIETVPTGISDSGSATASTERREQDDSAHEREKERKHAEIKSISVMLIDANMPSSASEEVQ